MVGNVKVKAEIEIDHFYESVSAPWHHQSSNWKLVIARCQPAINHKDCTCCETGFIGGKEERSVCDVNGLSDAS